MRELKADELTIVSGGHWAWEVLKGIGISEAWSCVKRNARDWWDAYSDHSSEYARYKAEQMGRPYTDTE